MKIKTTELKGTALDWSVAKALKRGPEYDLAAFGTVFRGWWLTQGGEYERMPSYSTDWSQGGPIIEREEIGTKRRAPCMKGEEWEAMGSITAKGAGYLCAIGPTPLIASMRCYVASKLGAEVEIPNELIGE